MLLFLSSQFLSGDDHVVDFNEYATAALVQNRKDSRVLCNHDHENGE